MRGRIFLFHWNPAEAEQLAIPLREDGWQVDIEFADGARGCNAIKACPPDAVVISLTRLPSHGRETATALKSWKATRGIPIIFAGGEGAALKKTQEGVPDATYTAADVLRLILPGLLQQKSGARAHSRAPLQPND